MIIIINHESILFVLLIYGLFLDKISKLVHYEIIFKIQECCKL